MCERWIGEGPWRSALARYLETYADRNATSEDLFRTLKTMTAAGRSVVFNASRRVVPVARARYTNAAVVLIDAPLQLRARRLATRDRERAKAIGVRLERVVAEFSARDVDLVIDNSGALCQAADALADWLSAGHGRADIP